MLSARSIYSEICGNDRAYQLLLSIVAKGETQGGWEKERIAELTSDAELARKIRRHGEDESKHGQLFTALLRKRRLEPVSAPPEADYCMLLEARGIGLSHARLGRDEPLSEEELLRYLALSRVTEQRSAEEIGLQLRIYSDDPELKRALAMVADDEAKHLSYCHEELLRLAARGHGRLIGRMLDEYAIAEMRVYRQVRLHFIDKLAAILGWSAAKRRLLRMGVHAAYLAERLWGWRRMVRLVPPVRPNALGSPRAQACAGTS